MTARWSVDDGVAVDDEVVMEGEEVVMVKERESVGGREPWRRRRERFAGLE